MAEAELRCFHASHGQADGTEHGDEAPVQFFWSLFQVYAAWTLTTHDGDSARGEATRLPVKARHGDGMARQGRMC